MAAASQSKKTRKPPGGQVGMRGYLVQTLIALLDVVLVEPPFESLTLEPGHESQQFDLVWEDADGRHAMQVKSTDGQFAKADVEQWAAKLETSGAADEYRLRLVGLHATSLAKVKPVGRVALDKKNIDLTGFRAEAAHGLDRLLRREQLASGSADDREMLADALTARLATYSTSGRALSRSELVALLKRWVVEAPAKPTSGPSSILTHAAEKLFGREEDLKRLDDAWNRRKIRVLSIVAWGGVGKSSLVNHWQARVAARDYDGARYFERSFYRLGTREGGYVSANPFIADALKHFGDEAMANDPTASPEAKGARLAELISTRRTLLVLDGLEPLQYPPTAPDRDKGRIRDAGLAALVRGLARSNAGLCVITSRIRQC